LLETPRLVLRDLDEASTPAYRAFLVSHRASLAPWEPYRTDADFEEGAVGRSLARQREEREAGRGHSWGLELRDRPGVLVGTVALSNLVYGPFESAFLGYRLAEDAQGQGLMTEAVGAVVEFAFGPLGLHRIEANVMPRNRASRRVLERCGFVREGFSPRYLKVAGVWEDHEHFVRLNPAREGGGASSRGTPTDRGPRADRHPLAGLWVGGLELRPLHLDQLEAFWAHVEADRPSYSDTIPFVSRTPHLEALRQNLVRNLGRQDQGLADFFTLWDGDRMAGYFLVLEKNLEARWAEIGYMVGTPWRGRGLAVTVGRLLLADLFGRQGMDKAVLCCDGDNEASQAVARRLGFRLEGVLRRHMVVNGRVRNLAHFGLLREEWEAQA